MPRTVSMDEERDAGSKGCYVALDELADASTANLLSKHFAPGAVSPDGTRVMCLPMREARSRFSAREAVAGAQLFLAAKGENANVPVVMITLDQLSDMIREAERDAQEPARSLAAALAPSDDLPPAAPMRVRGGSFTSEPRFLTGKRTLAG